MPSCSSAAVMPADTTPRMPRPFIASTTRRLVPVHLAAVEEPLNRLDDGGRVLARGNRIADDDVYLVAGWDEPLMAASRPEAAGRHCVARSAHADRHDRRPVPRRQHRRTAADAPCATVARARPLRVHQQTPAVIEQAIQVTSSSFVEAAAAPVHGHRVEDQRYQLREQPVAVEVVRGRTDDRAPAQAAGKRAQDHWRVHMASVVRHEDGWSADARELLPSGWAPAGVVEDGRTGSEAEERF